MHIQSPAHSHRSEHPPVRYALPSEIDRLRCYEHLLSVRLLAISFCAGVHFELKSVSKECITGRHLQQHSRGHVVVDLVGFRCLRYILHALLSVSLPSTIPRNAAQGVTALGHVDTIASRSNMHFMQVLSLKQMNSCRHRERRLEHQGVVGKLSVQKRRYRAAKWSALQSEWLSTGRSSAAWSDRSSALLSGKCICTSLHLTNVLETLINCNVCRSPTSQCACQTLCAGWKSSSSSSSFICSSPHTNGTISSQQQLSCSPITSSSTNSSRIVSFSASATTPSERRNKRPMSRLIHNDLFNSLSQSRSLAKECDRLPMKRLQSKCRSGKC